MSVVGLVWDKIPAPLQTFLEDGIEHLVAQAWHKIVGSRDNAKIHTVAANGARQIAAGVLQEIGVDIGPAGLEAQLAKLRAQEPELEAWAASVADKLKMMHEYDQALTAKNAQIEELEQRVQDLERILRSVGSNQP